MAELTKEDYWGVLNGKLTLPEAMELFGLNKEDTGQTIESIKDADRHDSSNYFALVGILKDVAYMRLVEMKEIDDTKVFSFSSNKYDDENAREGDLGRMGAEICVHIKGRWQIALP